jgi:hypothetical protein
MLSNTRLTIIPTHRDVDAHRKPNLSEKKHRISPSPFLGLLGIFLIVFATLGFLIIPAGAAGESISTNSKVYVDSITLDPEVLFTGDKGTATFYVSNGNANESVVLNHATFGDNNIQITSGTYDSSSNIGPLQTRPYVFTFATDVKEGTYFPSFSISFSSENSLYYRTLVQVDNTPLILTVLNKPDTFTEGKKETLIIQIANPRKNDVKNVVLDISGNGVTATPSEIYIGSLASGAATNVTISVTPNKESPVNLTVNYGNGDNPHSVSQTIPVTFGTDKKKATPQMSNIQVKLDGSVYHVTGDVTNAGLTTANGVQVTALSPATAQDPYKTYIIGALKPDDFGSFEVSFSANDVTNVPLQISYKDADGNVITLQHDISISSAVSDKAAASTGNPLIPAIGLLVVIVIGAGYYVYNKRKKSQ